eukprot:31876-Hanusia_phi.AAC.2
MIGCASVSLVPRLAERMACKETTEMDWDDLSASQPLGGFWPRRRIPYFFQVWQVNLANAFGSRSRHIRRLKASFAYSESAIIAAGTVRYADSEGSSLAGDPGRVPLKPHGTATVLRYGSRTDTLLRPGQFESDRLSGTSGLAGAYHFPGDRTS